MPAPRPLYEEPAAWSRESIERALLTDDPEALLRAVIAVALSEPDQPYAEALCVRLARHPHPNVRGNALLAFGHLARLHGHLTKKLVFPLITAGLEDPDPSVRGQADTARSDTTHFLKWKYQPSVPSRSKAPPPA